MSDISADEISLKLKALLDELSALSVHSVILASFASRDEKVVFGMETNTSQTIARSLLEAASKRIEDMRLADASSH